MANIGYYLRRLTHMDMSHLNGALDKVQEKTGRSRASIFLDMTNCLIRYGAGYYEPRSRGRPTSPVA